MGLFLGPEALEDHPSIQRLRGLEEEMQQAFS